MALGIESEGAHDFYFPGNLRELRRIELFVGARFCGEHSGAPIVGQEIARELERAEKAAAARLRRKVKSDQEEFFHGRSVIGRHAIWRGFLR